MQRQKRYIVRLDEVIVTRGREFADIECKEQGVHSTRLPVGPRISAMSDVEIVEAFSDTLRDQSQMAGENKHVAVEVPLGSPQIEFFARGYQWENPIAAEPRPACSALQPTGEISSGLTSSIT